MPTTQCLLPGLDDQMHVIRHEAVGERNPGMTLGDHRQVVEKRRSVAVVAEDRLLPVPPRGDVMDATGDFDAWCAGHAWERGGTAGIRPRRK